MVHKRIVTPVLGALLGERAVYFTSVADKVEQDKRTEEVSNLVFMVLKETIPYLPTDLTQADLIDRLFAFVKKNQSKLNAILFDPEYIKNPSLFSEATKGFVMEVLGSALEQHEIEEIQNAKVRAANTYRFSFPDYESDHAFPYQDDDE